MNTKSQLQSLSPELLKHIISFIPDLYESAKDPTVDRRALISLTQVCRTLSGHALDRLWAHLPSIAPLLYTLPSDLCKIDRPEHYGPTVFVSAVS